MEHFLLFVVMSILLIILPGPDTGLVTKNTVTHGSKGGLQTMAGISAGLLIHTTAAVCGLSALIVKSVMLFSVFKYVGAIYLVYLGVTTLYAVFKKKESAIQVEKESKYRHKSAFLQGFLTNLLNPKVAVFFLTFLPQFLPAGSDPFLPFFTMGITYTILTVIWFLLYVYIIDLMSAWMKKPSTQRAVQGISGLVLLLFGMKLAFEKNP
ncbi:LysE family translocator [Brevibacillus reuszeri]|uniref:LysE family translocator n=1 Tax=Brevibacillus reuszeri TaxID=54915 RepID=UPI003D1D225F